MSVLPESPSSRRSLLVAIFLTVILFIAVYRERTASNFGSVLGAVDSLIDKQQQHTAPPKANAHGQHGEKLAYATWLSSTIVDPESDYDDDVYFIATRMLVYQLLHAPKTRTRRGIDVVVMVTPEVSISRRERLKADGAIVRPVSIVQTGHDWISPQDPRWRDVLSKLHVWELTQYSRVLLLDGDTVLQRSLDGVFDDPNARIIPSLSNETNLAPEAALPSQYLLASTGELPDASHKYPPDWDDFKNPGQFCAGFLLLAPSHDMFQYFTSILSQPGSFDSRFPEQGLMNYVHRWDGPMPWREVDSTWNLRSVNSDDFTKGVASMHEKWWEPVFSGSREVAEWFVRVRWEMEGFYQAHDERDCTSG